MANRLRRKSIAACATLLAVGVVVTSLLFGKARERKEVVGPIVAGYRYRCTLSTDWKLRPANPLAEHPPFPSYDFQAYRNPILEWITTHLLSQSPTKGNATSWQPTLGMDQRSLEDYGPWIKIKGTYPRFDSPGKLLSERNFRIDGCPATLVRYEQFTNFGSQSIRETFLCVAAPDSSGICVVSCLADRQDSEAIDKEVNAIVSSFHVEKVAASTDKKR